MRLITTIILAMFLTNCTAVGNRYEGTNTPEIAAEIADRFSARVAWYCGEEWFSVRAVARVTISIVVIPLGFAGVRINDQCVAYYEALSIARDMVEAEEAILREGLINSQEIPNG